MPRIRKHLGGHAADLGLTRVVDQPRNTLEPEDETISVDTVSIMASHPSVASVASFSSLASRGTTLSVASVASRASAVSLASQGTLPSAASFGTVASFASSAFRPSLASIASQGTSSGFSQSSRASASAIASLPGPVLLTLPDQADADNVTILKKGASGTLSVDANDSATINGQPRRTLGVEHQVDFLFPNGTDWTATR